MNSLDRLYDLVQHFQPVVDIKSNEISHYEVLLRGGEPKFNIGDFISNLEENGEIFELDSWNLITLAQKIRAGNHAEGKPCAINLSANTIEDPRFLASVKNAYEIMGLRNADKISFEITETAEIKNFDTVASFVENVKKLGSTVSVDDYGAGYASKEYIDKLNVDTIKIDGVYVDRMLSDPDAMEFIKQAVSDAKENGLSVIAERVEKKEELEILVHLGVDKGQGYLFGKAEKSPMKQTELDRVFERFSEPNEPDIPSLSMQ